MSRQPLLAAAGLLVLLVAGCAGPAPEASPADAPGEVGLDVAQTGPAVGPDLDATTAAAPRLIEGEWWRIRFAGDIYTGQDVLRVVANATPEGYVFGMPHEGWLKEAIAYHAPAFGDVAPDLSYAVHNERFQPLRFPLVAGDRWPTTFGAADYEATVESADDATATVRLAPVPGGDPDPVSQLVCLAGAPCDGSMTLTYDARVHEVVRMTSPIGSWEVVEHGYQFVGWVTVPDGMHTAIDYGTFGPDAGHPTPTRTVHVDESFNRMTLLHGLVALSPGAFRLTSTSPVGETFTTESVGAAGVRFAFYEATDPGGDWTQEDVAVGAGGTYTMGLAYQQYDILVPDGARRPTHGHEVVR